jgi:hypothetical protein
VHISKPITNGLTYDFTFNFEKAGETPSPVPISAGEARAVTQATHEGRRHGRSPLRICRSGGYRHAWPRRVRSTAVRSATTSPRNGSAAARTAAPGRTVDEVAAAAPSTVRRQGGRWHRRRPPCRSSSIDPGATALSHRRRELDRVLGGGIVPGR